MPNVTYHRTKQYAGRVRKMKIFHDGVEVGTVSVGQDLILDLAPGPHTLSASMDWCRRDLGINLIDGMDFIVDLQFRGNAFLSAARMIFTPSEAISMTVRG